MLNAAPLNERALGTTVDVVPTTPIYFDGLNTSPLNQVALNSPELTQGTSTPARIPVLSTSSVQANYDILNVTGITGGLVYEPKLVGYRRRYIGSNGYDATKMASALSDVYETIKSVLMNAGFDLTEDVITTDQEYKYLDIKQRGATSIDSPKSVVFMPTNTSVLMTPYMLPYYGATVPTSNLSLTIYTAATLVPDANMVGGTLPTQFNQVNGDTELTIVADGTRGIYWYTISSIYNGTPYIGQYAVCTYSNRVPEDQSTPEQSCTRYGTFDLSGVFQPSYGNTYVYSPLDGFNYIANLYLTDSYSLFQYLCNFVTPQAGLSEALIGDALVSPTNQYYYDPIYFQISAPALFGPIEGVKSVSVTNPLPTWSVVNDGKSDYVYLGYDLLDLSVGRTFGVKKFAFFCPSTFTQLTDFT